MNNKKNTPWYQSGLAFQCRQCGNCCAGPDEGYVWINKDEIEQVARFLNLTVNQLKKKYLRRVALRYRLLEKQPGKDCIFLIRNPDRTINCQIYPHRPLQCRTWPFWKENLRSAASWRRAAQKCPGLDQGPFYDLPRILALRSGDLSFDPPVMTADQAALDWIKNNLDNDSCLAAVEKIYHQIDRHLHAPAPVCDHCGQCCHFHNFGHRLYCTTLEMLYLIKHLPHHQSHPGQPDIKPTTNDACPYQQNSTCTTHPARTAGCRIFYCRNLDPAFQNELTEKILQRLRQMHLQFHAVYLYADLGSWLNLINSHRLLFPRNEPNPLK